MLWHGRKLQHCQYDNVGRDSSVGIVTGYGQEGPVIESRCGGARFSVPVQTSLGAHPASCTMGTGSFLGVKIGRDVKLTPHPLLVPWSWKGRAIPQSPYGPTACTEPQWLYKGDLYLFHNMIRIYIDFFLKERFITQRVYTGCTRINYKIVPATNFNKYLHYGKSGNE